MPTQPTQSLGLDLDLNCHCRTGMSRMSRGSRIADDVLLAHGPTTATMVRPSSQPGRNTFGLERSPPTRSGHHALHGIFSFLHL